MVFYESLARFGLLAALVAIPFAASTGCGSTREAAGDDDDDDSSHPNGTNGSNGEPSFGGADAGSSADADHADDCAESAKLVYVTGYGSKLWSFDPSGPTFKEVGTFSCLGGQLPTHMTVDRKGTAWVVS